LLGLFVFGQCGKLACLNGTNTKSKGVKRLAIYLVDLPLFHHQIKNPQLAGAYCLQRKTWSGTG
jgi:hypothetical protein